jgi:hypothetical protein
MPEIQSEATGGAGAATKRTGARLRGVAGSASRENIFEHRIQVTTENDAAHQREALQGLAGLGIGSSGAAGERL